MKLNAPQLPEHLKKSLAPLYLVTGDEPLLVQEACDQIRKVALEAGFSERKVFHGDPQVDWNRVLDEARSMSLFAEKQRIEVRLPSSKLAQGRQFVEDYLASPSEDAILILSGPRLDAAELKRAWYKKLQKDAVHVQVWPVEPNQFPGWLRQRAGMIGLNLSDEAIHSLADRVEGNLLAAHQELERLKLASDSSPDGAAINDSVMDNTRFNAFQLTAEALSGRTAHAQKMLTSLKMEGTATLPILAVLSRDLKHTLALQHAMAQGKPAAGYFKDNWIRQRQQIQSIEAAALRLRPDQARDCLALCQAVDRATKGFDDTLSPWICLQQLIQALNPTSPLRN